MRALYKRPGQAPQIEILPDPVPATGEVLLKPRMVGLCRTDLYVASELIWRPDPLILGHEFSAEVVDPNGSNFNKGDIVTVNPMYGKKFMGLHFNGALADLIAVPSNHVYLGDPTLADHLIAYAEPVAAALATSKLAITGKGAIYGENRIAELSALVLRSRGIEVPILNENAPIPEDTYDFIIETVLRPADGKKLCWGLKPNGTLILKSRKADEVSFPVNLMVLKDITFKSVSYGEWSTVIPWIKSNKEKLIELVGPTFQFADAIEAFNHAGNGEAKKTFINICAE